MGKSKFLRNAVSDATGGKSEKWLKRMYRELKEMITGDDDMDKYIPEGYRPKPKPTTSAQDLIQKANRKYDPDNESPINDLSEFLDDDIRQKMADEKSVRDSIRKLKKQKQHKDRVSKDFLDWYNENVKK